MVSEINLLIFGAFKKHTRERERGRARRLDRIIFSFLELSRAVRIGETPHEETNLVKLIASDSKVDVAAILGLMEKNERIEILNVQQQI